MNEFNSGGFQPMPAFNPLKDEEKKKIRKTSNLIGAVFIAVWFIPDILNSLFSDVVVKIIGLTPEVQQFISDPAFLMVLQTFYSVIMFTLPFLILPAGLGKRVSEIVTINKPKWNLFFAFLFIGVGFSAFANLMTNQLGAFFEGFGIHFKGPDFNYPSGAFGMVISYLAVAVTPALVEEFANRGVVMGAARRHGELFGLITSATFFALMHGNLVQIPFAFFMGIVIGYAVIKSGSLITGMVIHFLNNAIAVTMSYTVVKIESIVMQGVVSLVYIGVCTILLLLGLYLAQRKDKGIWRLEKGEELLKDKEKFKCFFSSPAVLIAILLTVIDCLNMISIG